MHLWQIDSAGLPNLKQTPPSLVVVANASDLAAASVAQLEDYVQSGGRLLVFAGNSASPESLAAWQSSSLAPGKLVRSESAAAMPFRISNIPLASTMLAPFLDPQQGDLSRLAFNSLLCVDMAEPERVLASFDSGRPAITQHVAGSGRVAWFMASADNSSGDWTTSPLYLPLVRQMAADLLGRTGEGLIRYRSIGDPLPSAITTLNPSENSTANRKSKGKSSKQSAQPGPLPKTTGQLYFEQPGFIRLPNDQALYVVNPPAKESDPTRVEPSELAKQLGIKLVDQDNAEEQLQTRASYYELWPYLVGALLTLLVFEFALSNRTSA